jgi:hypothetical protein
MSAVVNTRFEFADLSNAAESTTTSSAPNMPYLQRPDTTNTATNDNVSVPADGVVAVPSGTLGSQEIASDLQDQGSVTSYLVAEWEGHVTRIGKETFEARLRGISGEGVDGELEEAIIPIAEVTAFYKTLFEVGAIFRLCVSYDEYQSGQIRRYTELVFRRLPAYRQKDLDDARKRARERLSELRLE